MLAMLLVASAQLRKRDRGWKGRRVLDFAEGGRREGEEAEEEENGEQSGRGAVVREDGPIGVEKDTEAAVVVVVVVVEGEGKDTEEEKEGDIWGMAEVGARLEGEQ